MATLTPGAGDELLTESAALHGKQRFRHSGSGLVQPDGGGASNDVAVLDVDRDGIACLIEIETRQVK